MPIDISNFESILGYNNEDLIRNFMASYEVSYIESSSIFLETKKWLWLCSQAHKSNFNLVIHEPILIIDEMWHNFLLFTYEYNNFCNTYLDLFIHHQPSIKYKELSIFELRRQLSFIYDNLGSETLNLWYKNFSSKYTLAYINSIRKDL